LGSWWKIDFLHWHMTPRMFLRKQAEYKILLLFSNIEKGLVQESKNARHGRLVDSKYGEDE
jgi:hypothetical protein